MAKKYDGVIEAVHYKNGQIVVVRAFERRGAAFSDRVMIGRNELLDRLKDGKTFADAFLLAWLALFQKKRP